MECIHYSDVSNHLHYGTSIMNTLAHKSQPFISNHDSWFDLRVLSIGLVHLL